MNIWKFLAGCAMCAVLAGAVQAQDRCKLPVPGHEIHLPGPHCVLLVDPPVVKPWKPILEPPPIPPKPGPRPVPPRPRPKPCYR